MSNDLPKRRWPQIYLSTALVMMFTLGALLFSNLAKPYSSAPNYTFGWPLEVFWPESTGKAFHWGGGKYGSWNWTFTKLLFNFVFSIGTVAGIAFIWQRIASRSKLWLTGSILIYVMLCALTSIFGAPKASDAMFEKVKYLSANEDVVRDYTIDFKRISPTEFHASHYFGTDVVIVSTPFPFILKSRMIDSQTPPYDLEWRYFFWCWSDPREFWQSERSSGMRR